METVPLAGRCPLAMGGSPDCHRSSTSWPTRSSGSWSAWRSLVASLAAVPGRRVAVDGLQFDLAYLECLGSAAGRTLVIDDLAALAHVARVHLDEEHLVVVPERLSARSGPSSSRSCELVGIVRAHPRCPGSGGCDHQAGGLPLHLVDRWSGLAD